MSSSLILYVEDNFHNRRLVRKILESRHYTLQEAEDGLSGLQMIYDLQPTVVLLDIGLPGIDGLEITRRLKADPTMCHIPLIAITASAMAGDRERFLSAGCDDYLSKPIQPLDLLEKVAYWMTQTAAAPKS